MVERDYWGERVCAFVSLLENESAVWHGQPVAKHITTFMRANFHASPGFSSGLGTFH